jgi:hypothetical protein
LVAGIMGASLLAGQVTSRTGRYKIFPVIGSGLLVVGMLLLTRVGADTPLWQTDLYMIVFGAGLGLNMQSIVLAMQNAVEPRDMGVATSATTFFRQVGGSMGTAVFLSILFSTAASNIPSEYASAQSDPAFMHAARLHPDQIAKLHSSTSLNDTSFLKGLDPTIRHPFLVGFSDAMDLVFLVGAIVLVAAFVLASRMKEVPLRTVSGLQAAKASEQARAEAAKAQEASPSGNAAGSPDSPTPPFKATMPGAAIAVDEYVEDQGEARTRQ